MKRTRFNLFVARMALLAILATIVLGVASFGALAKAQTADTAPPSYVDNLQAMPGDGSVTLSWDAATDNRGVVGYKIYYGDNSVLEAGQNYDDMMEVGNVLEYTVSDLQNGTPYYFSITALDAADNESVEYSFEATATPAADAIADNGIPPTVTSVETLTCDSIALRFSEGVVFPATNAGDAFTIENLDNLQFLNVVSAQYHLGNSKNVLRLTTDSMEAGAQYLLTVGVSIKDLSGSPVVSGTSDTAIFSGMACPEEPVDEPVEEPAEDPVAAEDVDAPKLEAVELVSLTELKLTFDEPVVLPEPAPAEEAESSDDTLTEEATESSIDAPEEPRDPALDLFSLFDANNNTIEVLEVSYDNDEHTMLRLVTAPHAEGVEYFISVTGLADELGHLTPGDFRSSASYTTPKPEPVLDLVAPENVRDVVFSVMNLIIGLNWQTSVNSAGDLVDQYLYVSRDGGTTFERAGTLGPSATDYSFEGGVEGETYVFKVTTVDESGNESEGVIVTAALPMTGPALGLLAVASLFGGSALARRRKKKQ